jgi:hypothetical protein
LAFGVAGHPTEALFYFTADVSGRPSNPIFVHDNPFVLSREPIGRDPYEFEFSAKISLATRASATTFHSVKRRPREVDVKSDAQREVSVPANLRLTEEPNVRLCT